MESLGEYLKHFLKEVLSLPEDKMRLAMVGEKLKNLQPDEIARLLDMAYRNSEYSVDIKRFLAVIVRPGVLEEALGKELFKKTYINSMELGLEKVSRLFTNLPASKIGPAGYDKEEEAKMEYLTLGERRALAKTSVKDNLDRLASDPDPIVITYLLNNPKTVERDVVRIISKRPNSGKILELIAKHEKWSRRYSVKKSLVLNPYTPTRVSTALMEFMMTQDIKYVMENKSLHVQLKAAARDVLMGRGEDIKLSDNTDEAGLGD